MSYKTGISCSRSSVQHSTSLRWSHWEAAPPSWGYPSSKMSLRYLDVQMNETQRFYSQYNHTYKHFLRCTDSYFVCLSKLLIHLQ